MDGEGECLWRTNRRERGKSLNVSVMELAVTGLSTAWWYAKASMVVYSYNNPWDHITIRYDIKMYVMASKSVKGTS